MDTAWALEIPQFLEDQNLWLSVAAWAVLLRWLWPRLPRRWLMWWLVLACALHAVPMALQLRRLGAWLDDRLGAAPTSFWAMQLLNVGVLVLVVVAWRSQRRRAGRCRERRAVLAERRRIAGDLHDGLGSRLVALLAGQDPRAANDPGGLCAALQDCLLELHMTVDDLDDQGNANVVERLGHLRYRLQPAFDRAGIRLVWKVDTLAQNYPLRPDTALQVCRVAQEALSNALRHSGASCVELRFAPHGRRHALGPVLSLSLAVRDDGRGLSPACRAAPEPHGKGLRSMRARADAMHGELALLDVRPHGLCIRLLVPCQQPATHRRGAPMVASML